MPARVPLVVPIALALLLQVGSVATALGADERPVPDYRAAEPGHGAPASEAQAAAAQSQEQPAQTQQQPAQETVPALIDPAWRSSSTGRQIPDPTGTRFFRPAVSGGTGVVAW